MPATDVLTTMAIMRKFAVAAAIAITLACSIGSGENDMAVDPAQLGPFCDLMRDLDKKSLAPFSALADEFSDEQYDAAMAQSARFYVDRAKEIEKAAPTAVRKDVLSVLNAYRAYADGNTAAFEGEAYLAATDRLDEWLEKHCGIVLTEPDEGEGA